MNSLSITILDAARVREVLSMADCIDAMAVAMRCVRDLREVRVWGRTASSAREFAARYASGAAGTRVVAVDSAEQAAACDIVCVVTGAHEPVIHGSWLQPGAHVNLVGAHTASTREAETREST